MCRCICLPGETVVQRREVPDVVQDCIHHAIAKEEGDRLWCNKQLSTYFESAHYIEDVVKTVHVTYHMLKLQQTLIVSSLRTDVHIQQ